MFLNMFLQTNVRNYSTKSKRTGTTDNAHPMNLPRHKGTRSLKTKVTSTNAKNVSSKGAACLLISSTASQEIQ